MDFFVSNSMTMDHNITKIKDQITPYVQDPKTDALSSLQHHWNIVTIFNIPVTHCAILYIRKLIKFIIKQSALYGKLLSKYAVTVEICGPI